MEEDAQGEILYEISLPVLTDEPDPDFSELFKCRLPDNITPDFFSNHFQKFPFIQQAVYARALPNSDFPPLPTVLVSALEDPAAYAAALPVNQRQLTVAECDELCRRPTATAQLKGYLREYWLIYEPYIPKWPIVESVGLIVPDDEHLPPHASSFRSQFDAKIAHQATQKQQQALNKQVFSSGIHHQCFNAGILCLNYLDMQYNHLIPMAAGWFPGQEIEDAKTSVIVNCLSRCGSKVAAVFLKQRASVAKFSELTADCAADFVRDTIKQYMKSTFGRSQKNFEAVPQELSDAVKEQIQGFLQEADRLEELIGGLQLNQFELLEGEFIVNEEKRRAAQIQGLREHLAKEMQQRNECFNEIGALLKVPKSCFVSLRGAAQRYQSPRRIEPVVTVQKRFAPHPQSLPPSDSQEHFYNQRTQQFDESQHTCSEPTTTSVSTNALVVSRELVTSRQNQQLIISNRATLPQFLMDKLARHALFNRPNLMIPPTCFFKSGSHGFGLFALAQVPSQSILCEYAGEVIGSLLTELRDEAYQHHGFSSVYMFDVRRDQVIDATFVGSYGRFINHCCDPNSESSLIFREGGQLNVEFKPGSPGVGVVLRTRRYLSVAQEATQNYNMAKAPYDKKIPCYCGSAQCTGFMN